MNKPAEIILGGRKRAAKRGLLAENKGAGRLGLLYKLLFNFPDGQLGWIPYVISCAKRKLLEYPADFIYVSGPPYSALIAGARIARWSNIPWFGELRDLWTDQHYYRFPD